MGPESQNILGVVIAVVGVVGAVLVALISTPRVRTEEAPAPAPAATPEGLLVSPEIWRDLSRRITGLETEVHELTVTVKRGEDRMIELDRLLRDALRIIRAQSRTLRRARLPDETLPPALVPYSID
jgi:uncharacterized protein involved in exopolysaccharide biosynthesis